MTTIGLLYRGLSNGIDLKPNVTATPSAVALSTYDYKFAAKQTTTESGVIGLAKLTANWADIYDIENDFDTTTGEYTVPASGYYHIKLTTTRLTATTKLPCQQAVGLNGTPQSTGWCHHYMTPVQSGTQYLYGESVQYLTAGDVLSAWVKQGTVQCLSFSAYMIKDTQYPFNLTSNVVAVTQNVLTKITTTTAAIHFDPSSSVGSTTSQWTCPQTGNYHLVFHAFQNGNQSGKHFYAKLSVNDATDVLFQSTAEEDQGGAWVMITGATGYRFTAGDVVSVYVFINATTGPRNFQILELSGFRISA